MDLPNDDDPLDLDGFFPCPRPLASNLTSDQFLPTPDFVIAQDLTQMQVHSNVSEADVGGVAEGKAARFRVDAYPKYFFEGTVTQVRNAPISIQNVVTYDAVVEAPNVDLLLKPGMTANARIVTKHDDDVLLVPAQALRFVPTGDVHHHRPRCNLRRSGNDGGSSSECLQSQAVDTCATRDLVAPCTRGVDDDAALHLPLAGSDLPVVLLAVDADRLGGGADDRCPPHSTPSVALEQRRNIDRTGARLVDTPGTTGIAVHQGDEANRRWCRQPTGRRR